MTKAVTVDARTIYLILRERLTFIIVFGVLFLIGSVIHLHRATPIYSVSLEVYPVQERASSHLSNLSEFASLAGLSPLGSGDEAMFLLFIDGLKSQVAAEAIVRQPELMHKIFAGEWSPITQSWSKPTSVRREVVNAVKRLLGIPVFPWGPPGVGDVTDYLGGAIQVIENRGSSSIVIVINVADPQLGEQVLTTVIKAVDDFLKQRELDRAKSYIEFLSRELNGVTVTEYRNAIVEVLSDQEKLRMMASSDLPFVAQPFHAPTVSLRPVSPNAPLILLIGGISGILVGCFLAILDGAIGFPDFLGRTSRTDALTEIPPLVSVVMTTYKDERTSLTRSIKSILAQTLSDLEFIIVFEPDDVNYDFVRDGWADPRLIALRMTEHCGKSICLNAGLAIARGRYIARMDGNDYAYPERLSKQVDFFRAHSTVGVLGAAGRLVDEDGNEIGICQFPSSHSGIVRSLTFTIPLLQPTVVWDRERVGYDVTYDPQLQDVVEDAELWFRLIAQGVQFVNLLDRVIDYRQPESYRRPMKNWWANFRVRLKYWRLGFRYPLLFVGLTAFAFLAAMPKPLVDRLTERSWLSDRLRSIRKTRQPKST